MTRTALLLVIAAITSGCYASVVRPLQLQSTGRIDPAQRAEAYGRALTALQMRGLLIRQADPVGGFLRTEVQPGWMACGKSWPAACSTYETSQLTVGADGMAILRRNMVAIGYTSQAEDPFAEGDVERVQAECDALIRYIVGETKAPPATPPAPAPNQVVPRPEQPPAYFPL